MIEKIKQKALLDGEVLIAAHRGTSGGNIIQNTIQAYECALASGADVIELDVILSTDGVFYTFHDGEEPLVFNESFDVRTLSSKEIDEKELVNVLAQKTGKKLNKLKDVLTTLQGRCVVNIDRSWFYWKEIITFIQDEGFRDMVILKSPVKDEYLSVIETKGKNIAYMPIVYSKEELMKVKHSDVYLYGVELIFTSETHECMDPNLLNDLKREGILTWVNAIDLGVDFNISGGFNDTKAILESKDKNWGTLVDVGFTMIQTDWPLLLKNYLQMKKGK